MLRRRDRAPGGSASTVSQKKREGKEKKKSSHAGLAIGKMTAEIILFLKLFCMTKEKTAFLSLGTSMGAVDLRKGSSSAGTHHL